MKSVLSNNLDRRAQLVSAIEYSVIGWYHLIHKKSQGRRADELINIINDLLIIEEGIPEEDSKMDSLKRISATSMKNYRNHLKDEFGLYIDFQKECAHFNKKGCIKLQADNPENTADLLRALRPVASYYLHSVLPSHSDEAAQILLKNISELNEEGKVVSASPLLALYYIIAFRHAARCGIQTEFKYREIMGRETTSRRVIPLAVVRRAPYINLIAKDKKDNKIKQFVLSSIQSLSTDLWDKWITLASGTAEREPFDYEAYKKDPEYRFLRSIKSYTFKMTGFTFYHFRFSWNLDWELIQEIAPT
jgi:hypothetical protein